MKKISKVSIMTINLVCQLNYLKKGIKGMYIWAFENVDAHIFPPLIYTTKCAFVYKNYSTLRDKKILSMCRLHLNRDSVLLEL